MWESQPEPHRPPRAQPWVDSSQVAATALDLLQNCSPNPLASPGGHYQEYRLGLLFQQVKLIHPMLPLILSALAFSPATCLLEHCVYTSSESDCEAKFLC